MKSAETSMTCLENMLHISRKRADHFQNEVIPELEKQLREERERRINKKKTYFDSSSVNTKC